MAVDDSYTKVLLHFEGADGSATFTDESGKVWTAIAPAQLDTAQYRFGAASGLFANPGGDGDYIRTPDHEDFAVGLGDYTIDFWLKTVSALSGAFFYQGKNDGIYNSIGHIVLLEASTGKVIWSPNYTSYPSHTWLKTSALNDGSWHHIACVRYGDVFTLYADGVGVATITIAGYSVFDSTYDVSVGAMLDGIYNKYNGWIDELRFSKGIARWTANFTPPTDAYVPIVPGVTSNVGLLKILPASIGRIPISGSSPQYWFQWGNYVVIEPVPDAVYSLKLFISDYPTTELTATIDYPASLPDEFHPCVVDYACFVLSLRMKKWKKAAKYYNLYIKNLKQRKKDFMDRQADRQRQHSMPDRVIYPSRRVDRTENQSLLE